MIEAFGGEFSGILTDLLFVYRKISQEENQMYSLTKEQKIENLKEALALKEKKVQNLNSEIEGIKKKLEKLASKN